MDFLGNILSGQDLVNKDYVDKVIPVVPTKLSELTNDLGLGSLAYKSSLVASDIPALDWSKITSGKPTTLAGYGITDAYTASSIDTKLADYLPLSGGTIKGVVVLNGNGATNVPLNIATPSMGNTGYIRFGAGISANELGHLGFSAKGEPAMVYEGTVHPLLHSGNYSDYALPLSGGTLTGDIATKSFSSSTDSLGLYIEGKSTVGVRIQYNKSQTGNDYDQLLLKNGVISWNNKPLLHSGNVGDYAPLRKSRQSTIDLNTAANGFYEIAYSGQTLTNAPAVSNSLFVDFRDSSGLAKMQFIGVNHSAALFFRAQQGSGATITSDWKQVAFTDSDISGNAATATRARYIETLNYTGAGWYGEKYKLFAQWYNSTICDWKVTDDANNEYKVRVDIAKKLATARTIWGQSFDGTSGVDGYMFMSGLDVLHLDESNLWLNYGAADGGKSLRLCGNDVAIYYGKPSNFARAMTINSSGNVGIGTTNPAYKLDVEGRIRMRSVMLSHVSDDLATSGSYLLQYYTPSNKLFALTSRSGSSSSFKNFIFTSDWSNGHIGLCNVPSPDHNVYVTGSLGITGAVTMSSSLSVKNEIYIQNASYSTSGEGSFLIRLYNGEFQFNSRTADGASKAVPFRIEYATNMSIFNGDARINGNLIVTGDSSSGSDIRFKDVIESKRIKIDDIANAPLFTFKWNDRQDDSIHLGTSAQYWEKVAPWLVKGEDFKTLDYATLGVAMGISLANKTLSHDDEIKILKNKVKALEAEINRLRRHDN